MTIPRDLSNLAPGANTSGVLQPSKGGTGLTAPGTTGNVLTSNGTAWVSSTPASSGSGGTTSTGNVTLTSASTGAQSITTTAFGQFVALPDATTMSKGALLFNIENAGPYPLRVKNSAGSTLGFIYPQESTMVGLSDNSTAAGVWNLSNIDPIAQTASYVSAALLGLGTIREVRIDADRLLFTYGQSGTAVYAQVYNETTQTWGTPTLVRSGSGAHIAAVTGANQALVCSGTTTTFEAVVLTFSGTSITVGTAASSAVINTITVFSSLFSIGSSWVVTYAAGGPYSRAMTISGATVTVGSEANTGLGGSTNIQPVAVSSTVFFVVSITVSTTIYVDAHSVSGTTITAGGSTTVSIGSSETGYRFTPISGGARWAIAYMTSGAITEASVGIISMSGSTPSLSNVMTGVTVTTSTAISILFDMIVSGSKLIVAGVTNRSANIVTDTSGTASAGTALVVPMASTGISAVTTNSNIATFVSFQANSATNKIGINFSGSSPTLETDADQMMGNSSAYYGAFPVNRFNGNFTNNKVGAWFYGTINYNFYALTGTSPSPEVMAVQNKHMYKAVTRARPAFTPTTSSVVGLSGNELVYFVSNFGTYAGAVLRFESIT